MSGRIEIEAMTPGAFAAFGDVLEATGPPDAWINRGLCGRYHDRARFDFAAGGRVGLSLFRARACGLPHRLEMMERHPFGSQAFIPMSMAPFLVIAAPDSAGRPGLPRAFRTVPGQAVNLHRGVWHGVLTPLSEPGPFAVVDRIGGGPNLEEHWFDAPFVVCEA